MDRPENLAARATAMLLYRRDPQWGGENFERRSCDDLDRRYRSLLKILNRARLIQNAESDFEPAQLYRDILNRTQADEKLRDGLHFAIGRRFPSAFANSAVVVAELWNKVPRKLRDNAWSAEKWAEDSTAWTGDEVIRAEFQSTALVLYLLTHLWVLRRILRHAGINELNSDSAADYPGLAFSAVLDEELDEIACRRELHTPPDDPSALFRANRHPVKRADLSELAGLAFSGGGIRSATFNLGVLQYLGKAGLLRHFDYLSTVSGGGYIGTWLHAFIHHADPPVGPWLSPVGIHKVEGCLDPRAMDNPQDPRVAPITFLRRYASYLTPQKGAFSTDTWTMLNIWLRNTFLNLIVLVLPLIALMLVPRGLDHAMTFLGSVHAGWFWFVTAIPPAIFIGLNLRGFRGESDGIGASGKVGTVRSALRRHGARPWAVLIFLVLPLFASSWLAATYFELEIPAARFDSRITSLGNELQSPDEIARNAAARELREFDVLDWDQAVRGYTPELKARIWAEQLRAKQNRLNDLMRRIEEKNRTEKVHRPGPDRQDIEARDLEEDIARMESWDDEAAWWFGGAMALLVLVMTATGWERVTAHSADKSREAGAIRASFRQVRGFLQAAGAGLTAVLLCACSAAIGAYVFQRLLVIGSVRIVWPLHEALTLSPLIFLGVISAIVFLQMGFLGRRFPDYKREWMARAGGLLGIFVMGWTGLAFVAVFGPRLVNYLAGNIANPEVDGGALAWIGSTLYGALSARKDAAGAAALPSGLISKLRRILIAVAPPMFILTLLTLLAWGLDSYLSGQEDSTGAFKINVFVIPGILAIAIWLSRHIDVNEFSLHQFYRNRLVRCYLGGARAEKRKPNPFTGFDAEDDLHLSVFAPSRRYSGPYPILNTTLNVVHGDELAWQERKGESFIFTPRFCGFDVGSGRATHDRSDGERKLSYGAYRATESYAAGEGSRATARDGGSGIRIGTAMAISGAAASPNMGPRSSLSLAFLMTLLDVRLGWWLGNPRRNDSWRKAGPSMGLWHLLSEMTSRTNDSGKYVYLSDGGHFENLGIYELVRRRCRYIVACDSEQDQSYKFGGLGNAIRKCRSDFGVEIEIDISQLKPLPGERFSRAHFAVGKIHYPENNALGEPGPVGTLIYLKSSLTGADEPADLLEYSMRVPEFPHESTANQWFDETHFESYRTLGQHVAEAAFLGLGKEEVRNRIVEGAFKDVLWREEQATGTTAAS